MIGLPGRVAGSIGWGELAVVLSLLVVVPGCVSLTSYNSPQTMKEGTGSFGGGVSFIVSDDTAESVQATPYPVMYGRIGMAKKWDVGLKIAPYFMYTDVKYQLADRPLDVATDLGVSYGLPNTVAAYPAIYIGTEHLYVGGRYTFVTGSLNLDENDTGLSGNAQFSGSYPSCIAGASIGGRFRVMPEVTVHFSGEGGDASCASRNWIPVPLRVNGLLVVEGVIIENAIVRNVKYGSVGDVLPALVGNPF